MLSYVSMEKPLNHIIDPAALRALAQSHSARDNFGPGSPHPYLAFHLDAVHPSIPDWLKELPCPIIGIGSAAKLSQAQLPNACDVILTDEAKLKTIANNIELAPIAAMILVQHLRASETLPIDDSLTAESFAYAAVQNGPEFQAWAASYSGKGFPINTSSPVVITRDGSTLNLQLYHPETHNAIGTQMRDALCQALDLALLDTDISKVTLTGNGASFSVGGAIEEFGQVSDPATAHWIRSLKLPAWYLARLQDKLHIHVNGAAIGAGAEIAGFGNRVTATPKAWFQLPELKYGLIPGAGGTASLPRRIGRQKTAYMALSMEKIRAKTALKWGLIDAIID